MRTVGTIFSVVLALYGAVKLYLAFRHNGDVDAYLLGVIVGARRCDVLEVPPEARE